MNWIGHYCNNSSTPEFRPHTEQHLKFVPAFQQSQLLDQRHRTIHENAVVRGNAHIASPNQHLFQQLHVVLLYLFASLEGDIHPLGVEAGAGAKLARMGSGLACGRVPVGSGVVGEALAEETEGEE